MSYLDVYLAPVRKDRLDAYRQRSDAFLAAMIEHGALTAVEAVGDDVPEGTVTSFPMAVRLEPGEIVVVAVITYRDRAHRDEVTASVTGDPRMAAMTSEVVDGRRMIWAGFVPVVTRGLA